MFCSLYFSLMKRNSFLKFIANVYFLLDRPLKMHCPFNKSIAAFRTACRAAHRIAALKVIFAVGKTADHRQLTAIQLESDAAR